MGSPTSEAWLQDGSRELTENDQESIQKSDNNGGSKCSFIYIGFKHLGHLKPF